MEKWEVVKSDTFNRKLIITKSTRRLVANFLKDEEAEYICNLHNSSISQVNQILEDRYTTSVLDLLHIRDSLMNIINKIDNEYYLKYNSILQ